MKVTKNTNTIKRGILRFRILEFLFSVILLAACPLWGQVNKKKELTVADYHLWGKLNNERLSASGNWAFFGMTYTSGLDTLFLKNTSDFKMYTFPKGFHGEFSSDEKWFAYHRGSKGVGLFNIAKEKRKIFPEASTFYWAKSDKYLVLYQKKEKKLVFLDVEQNKKQEINGVTKFVFNDSKDQVAYIRKLDNNYSLELKSLSSKQSRIICKTSAALVMLRWHKKKNSFVFMEELDEAGYKEKNHIVHYFNSKLQSFDPRKTHDFPKDSYVSKSCIDTFTDFFISSNNDKIFIPVGKRSLNNDSQVTKSDNDVQVWHYKDEEIYPRRNIFITNKNGVKQWVWDMTLDKFTSITSVAHHRYILNATHTHALLYSQLEYLPVFDHQGRYSDFYILNLDTHEKSLVLKKQETKFEIIPSRAGKYFSYFKDGHWWAYDIQKKKHIKITKNIPELCYRKFPDRVIGKTPISYPIWSKDDKKVFLSGQRNVWEITLKSLKTYNITAGEKDELTYSIYDGHLTDSYLRTQFYEQRMQLVDNKMLVIKALDSVSKYSGLYLWKQNKGLSKIGFGDIRIDKVVVNKTATKILYREERFDQPPKLVLKQKDGTKEFFQSNTHYKQFEWGRSEIIQYQNDNGTKLQGILMYPINFDPKKKYPMVVYPYNIKTREYNQYLNPKPFAIHSDKAIELMLAGYLVLFPDIEIEVGNTGVSAANSIIAATKKVMEKNFVDPKGIGLVGHSFGGYQVFFTITQTSIFSAAVSSAGFSDLVSQSLTVMPGLSYEPEMNFIEYYQTAMGKPYMEIPDQYIANSPIYQVKKINTPLLSWSGNKDTRVDWRQTRSMYIALRRLKKENVMLIYPEENHSFVKEENISDLSIRLMDWFDYHLKKKKPKDWIVKFNQ